MVIMRPVYQKTSYVTGHKQYITHRFHPNQGMEFEAEHFVSFPYSEFNP